MKKVDFKIFVPGNENNYVRFDNNTEFDADIHTVNIHIADDKVIYWLYFKISFDDEYHRFLLRKGSHPHTILLVGNNPYEIHGESEIMNISFNKWEQKIEYTLSFTVGQASRTVGNPRKEIKFTREELMDL